ncbi:VOC family protein [Nocardioides jensenii]|uniref:VOC family protein n=1 Tax=Nocardioides jensenii TaxID=1843 RepID=UPI000832FFED|nr:VOC family protein [Nocardioides jensenii]
MSEDIPKGRLSGDEIATMGVDDWRSINLTLRTRFTTGDFVTGLRLVNAIGEAAEAANHHPDVDLRYPYVDVVLSSHDVHAKTQRDVDLARQISEIAAGMGISADPGAMQEVELGLDTWDADEIRPFWAAVLGLEQSPRYEEDLNDPSGNLPTLWFQDADQHDEPRQRFHLDLRVPPELAEQRIEAALAAGGVLVSDDQAPRFTVLADAQGNKVCVCTHIGRSD